MLLVLLWIAFIFYNSSNNYVTSNQISFKFLNLLKNGKNLVLDKDVKVETNNKQIYLPTTTRDKKLNLFIRKNAHAFEYIIIAVLLSHMLIVHGMRGRDAIIYILFISLLFAVTDEFHQLFIPGRGSKVSDVIIDFGGTLIGLGSYYLFKFKLLNLKKPKVLN
ncbi:MAG: VanZ family protein [Clostridiaceae bacterium]|nr:VanZ family protein [Clostridiaceae bacterium]